MSKHTPGPWKILPDTHRVGGHPNHLVRFVSTANWAEDDGDFSATGEIVATMTDSPNIIANARLIAAAPDLVEALSNMLKASEDWALLGVGSRANFQTQARAALAKARL